MKLRKRTLRFVADKNNDEGSAGGTRRVAHTLRRRATEVMNYRILRKMILIGISIGAAVLMIFYSFALLYNRTGRFSVAIENPSTEFAITLCETPDFNTRSSRLTNDQQVSITNISGGDLPSNVDNVNGKHNGENYLAYTFYCKNVGTAIASMHYELTFNNVTNDIDEAIRVRLYVNGEKTDYAKTKSGVDGTSGKEERFCDKEFFGTYSVCKDIINIVQPDEYIKFTVVIWLEGDDKDCVDSVINGKIKFDMNIEAKPPVGAE